MLKASINVVTYVHLYIHIYNHTSYKKYLFFITNYFIQDNTESAIDYRKLYEDERLKNETHKKQNSGTYLIL